MSKQTRGREEWDDDDDGLQAEAEDEFDDALENCGQIPQGGCMKAGSEECDFECPYRDVDLFADPDDDDDTNDPDDGPA